MKSYTIIKNKNILICISIVFYYINSNCSYLMHKKNYKSDNDIDNDNNTIENNNENNNVSNLNFDNNCSITNVSLKNGSTILSFKTRINSNNNNSDIYEKNIIALDRNIVNKFKIDNSKLKNVDTTSISSNESNDYKDKYIWLEYKDNYKIKDTNKYNKNYRIVLNLCKVLNQEYYLNSNKTYISNNNSILNNNEEFLNDNNKKANNINLKNRVNNIIEYTDNLPNGIDLIES